tara:strand:- start:3667 stop:5301 length:1635 start_codon:yes stop_codon:yes gene_type:complete
MSFEANPNTQFIPTKTIKLYPDARVNLKANGKGTSQMNYTIPSYLNFVDPRTLRLRYNLTMAGRGLPKPNPVAGVHSLWRHMRLQTYDGLNILEEVDEYSSRVAMEYSYAQDESVITDRELNEGLSLNSGNQHQLFWFHQPTPTQGITGAVLPKKVAISQPLYSGILGKASRVVPVAAMGGLRLTMETNSLMKSIKDFSRGVFSDGFLVGTNLAKGAANNASLDHTIDVELQAAVGVVDGNTFPFAVGDRLYVSDTDEAAGFSLGMVLSVGINGAKPKITIRPDVAINSDLSADLTANTTKIYVKALDRWNGWTPGANFAGPAAAIVAAKVQAQIAIDYTIEDVEMIVEQVQPPAGYVDSMVKKINSSEGLELNYKNTTLYKVNVVGTNGLLNVSIPNMAKRGYAVNCMPLNSTDTLDGNNLTSVGADGAQSYQFVVNSQLTPDQRCSMRRMSLTPAYVEQLHLQEVRKSLLNSGVDVKSLQNADQNVLISRAFSKYGATSDTTKSDLSLRVEYSGATRQKTFNCYFCSMRTLIIKANEMMVVY